MAVVEADVTMQLIVTLPLVEAMLEPLYISQAELYVVVEAVDPRAPRMRMFPAPELSEPVSATPLYP